MYLIVVNSESKKIQKRIMKEIGLRLTLEQGGCRTLTLSMKSLTADNDSRGCT